MRGNEGHESSRSQEQVQRPSFNHFCLKLCWVFLCFVAPDELALVREEEDQTVLLIASVARRTFQKNSGVKLQQVLQQYTRSRAVFSHFTVEFDGVQPRWGAGGTGRGWKCSQVLMGEVLLRLADERRNPSLSAACSRAQRASVEQTERVEEAAGG